MNNKKIYALGFNKCATTSLTAMFNANGIPCYHDILTRWVEKKQQYLGNDPQEYQAFAGGAPQHGMIEDNSDLSIPSVKKYLKDYPDSIFILQTRPLEDWLISRFRHGYWTCFKTRAATCWAWPPTHKLAKTWIDSRHTHYLNVLEFFKKIPSKLVIVDISKKNWGPWLCNHLKLENSTTRRENVTLTRDIGREFQNNDFTHKITSIVDSTFKDLGYTEKNRKISLLPGEEFLKIYKNNLQ